MVNNPQPSLKDQTVTGLRLAGLITASALTYVGALYFAFLASNTLRTGVDEDSFSTVIVFILFLALGGAVLTITTISGVIALSVQKTKNLNRLFLKIALTFSYISAGWLVLRFFFLN